MSRHSNKKKSSKSSALNTLNISVACVVIGTILLGLYLHYEYGGDGYGLGQLTSRGDESFAQSASSKHDVKISKQDKDESKSKKKKKDAVPGYFEYRAMAKKQGWTPVDPLEKLMHVTSQFGSSSVGTRASLNSVDDPSFTAAELERDRLLLAQNMSLLTMRQQELAFLIEVLKQPWEFDEEGNPDSAADTDDDSSSVETQVDGSVLTTRSGRRRLDISEAYFHAVETLQRCVYSHLKYSLGANEAAAHAPYVVTKTSIEASGERSSHEQSTDPSPSINICYHPVQQLLKLRSEAVAEEEDHAAGLLLARKKGLRIALEAGLTGADLDMATDGTDPDKRKLKHLVMRLGSASNRSGASTHNSLLGLVVRSRQYRILPAVLAFAADVDDIVLNGMHYAVVNGDDFALGVLIRSLYQQLWKAHGVALQREVVEKEMKEMRAWARKKRLGEVGGTEPAAVAVEETPPPTIEQALAGVYRRHSAVLQHYVDMLSPRGAPNSLGLRSEDSRSRLMLELVEPLRKLEESPGFAVADVVPPHMTMEFVPHNSFYATEEEAVPGSVKNSGDTIANGGFADLGITATPSYGGVPSATHRCAVDRLDMANPRSLNVFREQYMARNKPVVLFSSGDTFERSEKKDEDSVERRWAFERLLDEAGTTRSAFTGLNFTSASIPYASLFGAKHTERQTDLRQFLADMRAYTNTLRGWLQESGLASAGDEKGVELLDIVAEVQRQRSRGEPSLALPRYIFDNKVVAMAMLDQQQQVEGRIGAVNASALLLSVLPRRLASLVSFVDTVSESDRMDRRGTPPSSQLLYQWYLGPALSGAPFHSHAPAFNVLVHGRKLWQLLPPARDLYSRVHPVDWLAEVHGRAVDAVAADRIKQRYPYYPEQGQDTTSRPTSGWPCMLEQRPGEVLFVPRHVTHQVINLAEVVGFAVETSEYYN